MRRRSLQSIWLPLMAFLFTTHQHTQVAMAQEGLSLRGNKPRDIMSIQMSPPSMPSLESDYLTVTIDLKCFETTEELRQAVQAYKGYNQIDTHLASTYGWPINNWCVSGLTDFTNVFLRKTTFNEPLNNWDMSSATSLSGMFMSAFEFNQSLDEWDVSRVTDFSRMFHAATNFNSDIRNWNTTRAEDMSYMFMHAHSFHYNLFGPVDEGKGWDVRHVQHMQDMFEDSRAMVDMAYDTKAWPLLKWQNGTPTIKLTRKEQRQLQEQLQEQQQQQACSSKGNGLRGCG